MIRPLPSIVFICSLFGLPACAETLTVSAGSGLAAPRATGATDVSLTPGLKRSKDLPSADLIAARKALVAGSHVSANRVRQLADFGDGFAAYRYAQFLEDKDNPSLSADIAHYYGIAAATGRGGAIKGMIRGLEGLDPAHTSEGRIRELRKVFLAYVAAGNPHAVEATMAFHLSQKPFGELTEEIDGIVKNSANRGAGKLSLQLASAILQKPDLTAEEVLRAKEYLKTAAASKSLSVSLIAQNLIQIADAALVKQASLPTSLVEKESN